MYRRRCIGFDADFTLITYKLRAFIDLQYRTLANCMVKIGCPAELLSEEFASSIHRHVENGLVADLNTGMLVKIDSDFNLIASYLGFKKVNTPELPYPNAKYHLQHLGVNYKENDRYLFLSHFAYGGMHVFRSMVELINRHNLPIAYNEIGIKMREALALNYDTFRGGVPVDSPFYSEFYNSPDLYLKKATDSLKSSMKKLKKPDNVLVLISNSGKDYVNFVFEYTFGPDWKSYFDIIIYKASKPYFFAYDKPFEVTEFSNEFRKGNSNELKERVLCEEYVYVGDHYVRDIYCPKPDNWKTYSVISELAFEKGIYGIVKGNQFVKETEPSQEIDYTKEWDSHFYVNGVSTFWWDLIQQNADVIGGSIDKVLEHLSEKSN